MKIDVILMAPNVFTIFTEEMAAMDPRLNDTGWQMQYDFKGTTCHLARIPNNQVRFLSDSMVITRNFNQSEEGIFAFLKLHLGCADAAIKQLEKN